MKTLGDLARRVTDLERKRPPDISSITTPQAGATLGAVFQCTATGSVGGLDAGGGSVTMPSWALTLLAGDARAVTVSGNCLVLSGAYKFATLSTSFNCSTVASTGPNIVGFKLFPGGGSPPAISLPTTPNIWIPLAGPTATMAGEPQTAVESLPLGRLAPTVPMALAIYNLGSDGMDITTRPGLLFCFR